MLKKYLPIALCLVLAVTTYYFYNQTQSAFADLVAQRAKNKIQATALAAQLERTAYWKKLYDVEHDKMLDAKVAIDIAAALAKKHIGDLKLAQDEIAKIKSCPDQVIALNFTLTQCREQYAKTVEDMGIAFEDFRLSCNSQIDHMSKNIVECEAAVTKYSDLYADTVAKHIRYVAKQRRGKLLWVGAGVALGILFKSL